MKNAASLPSMQTGDFRLIRNLNDRLVLNLIREHDEISGADLAQLTGLRPSTISNILKGLEGKSLIVNRGKGQSTLKGGKRPFLWALNKDSVYSLGVDIEIGQISVVLLGMTGETIAQKVYNTGIKKNANALNKEIIKCIKGFCNKYNVELEKVVGIGIAITGIVDRQKGTVVFSEVVPDINFSVTEHTQEEFGVPVIAENNANAVAMGSKWIGSCKGLSNFMVVLIEIDAYFNGMGTGLVLNGELYHGANYCSGEMNINFPPLKNLLSRAKEYSSSSNILDQYLKDDAVFQMSGIVKAAKEGDEAAKSFFSLLGQHIGQAIARPVAMINPERLVVAGEVAEVGELIINSIENVFKMEILRAVSEPMEVVASTQGQLVVARGAACILLEELFKKPLISRSATMVL